MSLEKGGKNASVPPRSLYMVVDDDVDRDYLENLLSSLGELYSELADGDVLALRKIPVFEPSTMTTSEERPDYSSEIATLREKMRKESDRTGGAFGFEPRFLICEECGDEFVFTVAAQEYFFERGYTGLPRRCKVCHTRYKKGLRGDERPKRRSAETIANTEDNTDHEW